MHMLDKFHPYQSLTAQLLPYLNAGNDGAHDLAHLLRVWRNAFAIAVAEGGDREVLAASVLLHDCVAVEKSSPLRIRASVMAADRAGDILCRLGWAPAPIEAVHHAIAAHSFSAGIAPRTPEARALQDADRLDAIGMVGVARCFYIAGRMGSAMYDPNDPRAQHRKLDDAAFAIDHFHTKLLRLRDGFQTETGRTMAIERSHRVAEFLVLFEDEIGASGPLSDTTPSVPRHPPGL